MYCKLLVLIKYIQVIRFEFHENEFTPNAFILIITIYNIIVVILKGKYFKLSYCPASPCCDNIKCTISVIVLFFHGLKSHMLGDINRIALFRRRRLLCTADDEDDRRAKRKHLKSARCTGLIDFLLNFRSHLHTNDSGTSKIMATILRTSKLIYCTRKSDHVG